MVSTDATPASGEASPNLVLLAILAVLGGILFFLYQDADHQLTVPPETVLELTTDVPG